MNPKNKILMRHSGRRRLAAALSLLWLLPSAALGADSMSYDAETATFSVQVSESTVKDVISYIEENSEYVFVYDQSVQHIQNQKVDISVNGKDALAILDELCVRAGLSYTISGRQVTISKKEQAAPVAAATTTPKKKLSGSVVDSDGEPLIGAIIRVKDSSDGTITDMDGNFYIAAPKGAKLVISYIGYDTKEITVGDATTYPVTLESMNVALEETVVIGYGRVKKKDLTGSVTDVKGEDVLTRRTTQISQALQGALSGVMVRRTGNEPGSSAGSIHIRGVTTIGDSSPLVIVDGVQGELDYVNANDVESISVLKDAAAASIYGSKAAAGVILVTTKRGSNAGRVNLKYTAEFGWEIPTAEPEMVGVTRYLEISNEMMYNDNPTGGYFQTYSSDQVKNWVKYNATDPDNYPITDWTDLILKSSAPRMTHSITLSGGNAAVQSNATLTYDHVDGLYYNRSYQRYMFRSNNDFRISSKLKAQLDVAVRHAKSNSPNYSPLSTMRLMPAIYPATWSDGRIASGKSGANPYGLLHNTGKTTAHSTQATGKASLTYTPIEGLEITGVIAPFIEYKKTKSFRYAAYYTLMDDAEAFGGYLEDNGTTYSTNKLTETRSDDYNVTAQVLVNYNKTFGKHDISAMVGFENYYTKEESLSAARDYYELTEYPYLNIGSEDYQSTSGTGSSYTSNSYFGRVMYSFANRYLFQANVRHDGSSRFSSSYRWGTFPSFSAGWVLTEEKFMKNANISWLSFLKLRGSWGQLGNERIGDDYFPYVATISFGNSYMYNTDGTVTSMNTARPGTLAVEDITWETTTSTDLGLDAYFLQNRLRFSFDYYWKTTDDMLLEIEIPYSMGYSNPNTNAGKMSTHGYDIELGWSHKIGEFSYSVSVNFSDFLSKVDYLNDADIISSGKIKRAGVYYNAWYGYICEGIYQTQEEVNSSAVTSSTVTVGDLKYKDINGDGVISAEYDRVPLGNSLPRYQYGGTINLGWRGIDMSITFQGVGKQLAYLDEDMVRPFRSNYGNVPAIIEGKYWSAFNTDEENANARYPRISSVSSSNNYAVSDFWLFNGRYFRLKNITLGYTLPNRWTERVQMHDVRFYASASDLFCISKYPDGWDPEMGTSSYPITTSIVVGVNVNF